MTKTVFKVEYRQPMKTEFKMHSKNFRTLELAQEHAATLERVSFVTRVSEQPYVKKVAKVAVFSNGFVDTYKGNRNVTAAWALFNAAGEMVASGHSFDAATARKTAAGHIHGREVFRRGQMNIGYMQYIMNHYVRPAGFRDLRTYNTWAMAENAKLAATYRIEVVAI